MAKKRIFIHKEENYDYTFDDEDEASSQFCVEVDEEKIKEWEYIQKRYEDMQEELAILKFNR